MLQIKLQAKHFKDTHFCYGICAIEKAIIDQMGASEVNEGVTNVIIDGKRYKHSYYGSTEFSLDKDNAKSQGYDETLLRSLILTPVS